ncbi:HTH domain-containing protein [Herbiconiux sp. P17]|uniref:HTH domain-containing protein n=1 Tax=Herbiconiux wuyangfengii TaxID=3342794 RepID=UPI0035BB9168
MSEAFDSRAALRRLIVEGQISDDALQTITGIRSEKIRAFLDEATPPASGMTAEPQALTNDESTRLSVLAVQLTEGLTIGDDERLTAIVESLTIECHLTLRNIAQLTGLDVGDLERVLRDPRSVPIEKKYELAVRGSYLINAVNQARRL